MPFKNRPHLIYVCIDILFLMNSRSSPDFFLVILYVRMTTMKNGKLYDDRLPCAIKRLINTVNDSLLDVDGAFWPFTLNQMLSRPTMLSGYLSRGQNAEN